VPPAWLLAINEFHPLQITSLFIKASHSQLAIRIFWGFCFAISSANEPRRKEGKEKRQLGSRRIKRYEIMGIGKILVEKVNS